MSLTYPTVSSKIDRVPQTTRRIFVHVTSIALVIAAVTACGNSEGDFTSTFMALDSGGDRPRTEFFTDTVSIFCGGVFASARTDVTVNAVIREVAVASQSVNVVLAVGEQAPGKGTNTVSFELAKVSSDGTSQGDNEPWPVGSFDCELSVNGVLEKTLPFTITMPECPVYPAGQGEVCQGFYPVGASCPAADQSMSCTCEATGTWSCT